ncbi:MAG: hypothetical protein ACREEJ_06440, partial [Ensifer adhaerens]
FGVSGKRPRLRAKPKTLALKINPRTASRDASSGRQSDVEPEYATTTSILGVNVAFPRFLHVTNGKQDNVVYILEFACSPL